MKKHNFLSILSLIFAFQAPTALAEKVEIVLVDNLNGILNGYCVDIAGGNRNVDISKGLQTHTCYSYRGSLGEDQIFETSRFANNELYMPNYDVCATLSSLNTGAKLGLATCEGNEFQTISLTDDGKLSPTAAPNLCLTAGEDTRYGRGGTSKHQIKTLTLENCDASIAAYQTWRVRSYDDDEK